jgi:hypothetical protein
MMHPDDPGKSNKLQAFSSLALCLVQHRHLLLPPPSSRFLRCKNAIKTLQTPRRAGVVLICVKTHRVLVSYSCVTHMSTLRRIECSCRTHASFLTHASATTRNAEAEARQISLKV